MRRIPSLGAALGPLFSLGPALWGLVAPPVWAATAAQATVVVYRCPGPPLLYTDALTPAQAAERACAAVQPLPLGRAPSAGAGSARPPVPAAAAAASELPAPSPASASPVRITAQEQRERDAQARRLLEAELAREEARLQQAVQAAGLVGATPAQVEEARAVQRRAQADVDALKRELARRSR